MERDRRSVEHEQVRCHRMSCAVVRQISWEFSKGGMWHVSGSMFHHPQVRRCPKNERLFNIFEVTGGHRDSVHGHDMSYPISERVALEARCIHNIYIAFSVLDFQP